MENNSQNSLAIGVVAVISVIILIVAGVFLSQNNQREESEPNPTSESTITQTAVNTPDLSTLVAALTEAGLADTFNASGNYTVFAPNNNAFSEIQSTVDQLLAADDKSALTDVLQYHVIDSVVFSRELRAKQTVTTLSGDELVIRSVGGAVYVNGARVVTADVLASNGVVHIIDQVLVPNTFGNIAETAQENSNLSTLVAAASAADLVGALSDETANYTVFAPTNAAFADIQSTVDSLLAAEDKSALVGVLQYHIVNREVFASQLSDGQVITTLSGETLTINISGGSVTLVGEDSTATVVNADILTTNGIVHVIDTVLLP